MTRTAIQFRFPGNFTFEGTPEGLAPSTRLYDYLLSELTIGNGNILGIREWNADAETDFTKSCSGYTPKEIHLEIVADLPGRALGNEETIRKKLITTIEDSGVSLMKFHRCGNIQDILVVIPELN